MNKALHPADVDKRPKIGQIDDLSFKDRAFFQRGEKLAFARLANFARGGLLGQDQSIARAIDFDHLGQHGLSDQRLVGTLPVIAFAILEAVAT